MRKRERERVGPEAAGRGLRHRCGTAALAAAMLVPATAARAADADGNFAIDGAGNVPCARYVEAHEGKTRDYFVFGGWIDGYVTANNQRLDGTYDLTPWQTTELLLDLAAQYCRENPERQFIYAVAELLRFLSSGRLTEVSEITRIGMGERGAYLYRETIRDMQRTLDRRGLYRGEIDGEFGEALSDAIRRFQEEVGLPADGWPDQRTLFALYRASRDAEAAESD